MKVIAERFPGQVAKVGAPTQLLLSFDCGLEIQRANSEIRGLNSDSEIQSLNPVLVQNFWRTARRKCVTR